MFLPPRLDSGKIQKRKNLSRGPAVDWWKYHQTTLKERDRNRQGVNFCKLWWNCFGRKCFRPEPPSYRLLTCLSNGRIILEHGKELVQFVVSCAFMCTQRRGSWIRIRFWQNIHPAKMSFVNRTLHTINLLWTYKFPSVPLVSSFHSERKFLATWFNILIISCNYKESLRS